MPLKLSIIASDPISRSLEYLNYMVFTLLMLFAISYTNYELALISIASILFMLIGRRWAGDAGVDKAQNRLTTGSDLRIFAGSFLAFFSFLLVDAAVYPLVGLAGAASSFFGPFVGSLVTLSALPASISLSINSLVAVENAISEEVLFRQAVTNYFVTRAVNRNRYSVGGVFVGILASGIVFGGAHVPVDGFSIVIVDLIIAGMITSLAGLATGLLATCQIAHILNNLLAVGLLYVLPPATASVVSTTTTMTALAVFLAVKCGGFSALIVRFHGKKTASAWSKKRRGGTAAPLAVIVILVLGTGAMLYGPKAPGSNNSSSMTTTTVGGSGASITFLTPGIPYTGVPNFYTSPGSTIQVQVPTAQQVDMVAFATTDRAYDPNPVPFALEDSSGAMLATGQMAFTGPTGHDGDFADGFFPVQLSQAVTLNANSRYEFVFGALPSGDSYTGSSGAGVEEGILQASGGSGYLGQAQWPIFELGMMALGSGAQNRNYISMTDLFSSPGYQGGNEIAIRFQASRSEQLTSFEVLAISSDGSQNPLNFQLRSDDESRGSHPGTQVISSSSVTFAKILSGMTSMNGTPTGSGSWVDVTFPGPQLTAGSYYWIVMSSPTGDQGAVFARLVNPYRELVYQSSNDFATSWGVPADGPTDLSFRITTTGESIVNTVTGVPKFNYFQGLAQSFVQSPGPQIAGAWIEAEPSPGGSLIVSLETDSGQDSPSGAVIAQGTTQGCAPTVCFVQFSQPAAFSGALDWLVIQPGQCSGSCSSPNYAYAVDYRQDMTGVYGQAQGLHYETLTGSWTTPDPLGDLNFVLVSAP